jgi:hypothetical protein
VKWFSLHRIEVSDVLLAPSQAAGAVMRVRIDPGQIGKWVEAQTQGLVVYLRHSNLPVDGRQLPLPTDPQHFLPELGIVDTIDEATGTIPLGGPHMPSPPPVFPAGAVLYIPTADPESALPLFVVEKKVVELLRSTNLPLNQDPDRSVPNKFKDTPVAIPGMLRPCKRHKLVGVYEGGLHVTGMVYRPTGLCKMRRASDGEFCFVCKYLIVNRVNPSLHALLDAHYPAPKKRDA